MKKKNNLLRIANSSLINILTVGVVYVADKYAKIIDSNLIGDNLGKAIFEHYPNLPMPKKELDDYIKAHPHKIGSNR